MKRLSCLVFLIFFLIACHSSGHYVRWVEDGDSIVLENGEKVRYLGINAPEIAYEDRPSEPFGKEALMFNMKLVKRKKVRLETEKESHDCYGRLLAYVFLDSGTFVNEEMVKKAGYAYVLFLNPNLKYDSRLLTAQRQAMRKKKNIWRTLLKETAPYYLGSTSSHKFHRPDCEYGKKIFPSHLIIFKDK